MTRTLPVRPDLEHLRREAKQLLCERRLERPQAIERFDASAPDLTPSLSLAQLVIAREYGLSSWPKLKALVAKISAAGVRYDSIGRGYTAYRRADPVIAEALITALGDARTVVNVGAGAGSYEPTDRPVIPVEPSVAMARQRDLAQPPVVFGLAESLPLDTDGVDAAMAVMTMHHWADVSHGVEELRRVARRRVVILTIDVDVEAKLWLLRDYAPQILERDRREFPDISWLVGALRSPTRVMPVPVPADCRDGFLLAFWSRPESVLDPAARAATSGFARLDAAEESDVVQRLERDLESGHWDERHGHLRSLPSLDVGLRLLVAELS